MKVGKAIQGLMERSGINGEQMSYDLFTSNSNISAMKHDRRNMQRDMAEHSLEQYNDQLYNMQITHTFSQGQTAPLMDGEAVDVENILALMINAKKEVDEAEETMELERFLRNPRDATEQDKEMAKQAYLESKEAAYALDNFCARLAMAYGLSAKELNEQLTRKWKANEVIR